MFSIRTGLAAAARGRAACAIALTLALLAGMTGGAWAATTYYWVGGSSGNWNTPGNWSPARTVPAADDILLFSTGGAVSVQMVGMTVLSGLQVSSGTSVTLQPDPANAVDTVRISGSGPGLYVNPGCSLTLDDPNYKTLVLSVSRGVSASIYGSMTFTRGDHQLIGSNYSPVQFYGGSVFTQGSGYNQDGAVVGGAFGPLTAPGVVFQSGSQYQCLAGPSPFGANSGQMAVQFSSGSWCRIRETGVLDGFTDGRQYANLEYNAGGTATGAGSGPLTCDSLLVTSGKLTLTGSGQLSVGYVLRVLGGATLELGKYCPQSGVVLVAGGGTLALGNSFYGSGNWAMNGTLQMALSGAPGSVHGTPPTYGSSSTLLYPAGCTTVDGEWTTGPGSGVGYPANVTVQVGPGSLDLGGDRQVTGTLSLLSGTLTGSGRTLFIASGGTISPGGGTLGVTTVNFMGSSTLAGGVGFNNVTLTSGTVDFGTSSTIPGALTITDGAHVSPHSPVYASTSTLVYQTSSGYTVGSEWITGSSVGTGVPQNVLLQSSGSVYASGDRTVPGTLTLYTGSLGCSTLSLGPGGVISGMGGSLTPSTLNLVGSATFTGTLSLTIPSVNINSGTVDFGPNTVLNGGQIQVMAPGIIVTRAPMYSGGGGVAYMYSSSGTVGGEWQPGTSGVGVPYAVRLMGGGTVALPGNRTVTYQLYMGSGTLSVGSANTLTIGAGGVIQGGSAVIAAGAAGGTVAFSGSGTITYPINLNNLNINSGSVDVGPGCSIGGVLQVNGGNLTSHSPAYLPGSTLKYSSGGYYSTGLEWSGGMGPGSGLPANVTIQNGTNVQGSGDRSLPGTLTLTSGVLSGMSNFNLASGGSIVYSSGGLGVGNVNFQGSATVSGSLNLNSVSLYGGTVDFGTSASVQALYIFASGVNVTRPPTYNGSGGIRYQFGGSGTVGGEWPAGNSGSGIPYRVDVTVTGTLSLPGDRTTTALQLLGGSLAIGSGNTLILPSGGQVTTSGGSFVSGPQGGTVAFQGAGTVTGGMTNFYNLTLGSGTVSLPGTATVAGTLLMNGGSVSSSSPFYQAGSTLKYAVVNPVGPEWLSGSTVGYGVPTNVTVAVGSGSTLNLPGSRTVPGQLSLVSGKLAGGSYTLAVGPGGGITASGGDFAAGASGGTVQFSGNATLSGTLSPWNVILPVGGAVDFGTGTTVGGSLTLGGGSVAGGHPPTYAVSSNLVYGTSYVLGSEWGAGTSGPGVPWHVQILGGGLYFGGSGLARAVRGDMSIQAGASLNLGGVSNSLGLLGGWSNYGSFSAAGGSVSFAGASSQSLSGTCQFDALNVSNSAGISLSSDLYVSTSLGISGGRINANAHTVWIQPGATVTGGGGGGGGCVVGNLKKWIPSGPTAVTFEVGDASRYAPVSLQFGNVTTPGYVTATTTAAEYGGIASSGLNSSKDANRYWTLINSGVAFDNYAATLNFVASDLDAGANPANFLVKKYSGGWSSPAVGVRTATSTQATGLTSFSDFVVGEPVGWTITATAGANGSIAPSGAVFVADGVSQAFTISPVTGYHLADVNVDGSSAGAVTTYTFTAVHTNHTIDASFAINTYTLTASAGPNGSVAPPGVTVVNYGGGQTYAITPDPGYHVADVLVDGGSVGAVTSYDFTGVAANHALAASFAINTYTLTASAGPGGSVSPAGITVVPYGGSQSYAITPAPGFLVADVVVDGLSKGAVTTYDFTGVTANHALAATFAANGIAAAPPASACVSTAHPCVTVPVIFTRTDATPVRGYSVKLRLGGGLVLCGAPAASIRPGPYLSRIGGTTFLAYDAGGGAYTVDEAILGLPCGATGTDTLFTVDVTSPDAAGTGTITMDLVRVRDCPNNAPVPAVPGVVASLPIDNTLPGAIAHLSAVQVKNSTNGTGGTTKIALSWPVGEVEPGARVEVWRAGFGNYPLYDNAPGAGSVPAAPTTYPPGPPWVLTAVTASGGEDAPAGRDYLYYAAVTLDPCGNPAFSNMTGGTLDYYLGDVSNGVVPGHGDNSVDMLDISLLGDHYALSGEAEVNPYGYLDVGPTTDGSVNGRPLTDSMIGFEDLMLFAVNFGQVNIPKPALEVTAAAATGAASSADVVTVDWSEGDRAGDPVVAKVLWNGTGRAQGASIALKWDPAVVTPAGNFAAATLLESQFGVAMTAAPGALDVALLGLRSVGLAGSGALATIQFRRIGEGDPGIDVRQATARDGSNRPLALGVEHPAPKIPRVMFLRPPVPNPSREGCELGYGLPARAGVDLSVYSVSGRRVRSLSAGEKAAGSYTVRWDGRDEQGRPAGSGIYYARLSAAGRAVTRALTLLR